MLDASSIVESLRLCCEGLPLRRQTRSQRERDAPFDQVCRERLVLELPRLVEEGRQLHRLRQRREGLLDDAIGADLHFTRVSTSSRVRAGQLEGPHPAHMLSRDRDAWESDATWSKEIQVKPDKQRTFTGCARRSGIYQRHAIGLATGVRLRKRLRRLTNPCSIYGHKTDSEICDQNSTNGGPEILEGSPALRARQH